MFYVTEENALRFWQQIEAAIQHQEADTRLKEQLEERLKTWQNKDNFALEWQIQLEAKEAALTSLKHDLHTATSGGTDRNEQSLAVTMIGNLIAGLLAYDTDGSSFRGAALIRDMAAAYKRNLVSEVFRYEIKEAVTA